MNETDWAWVAGIYEGEGSLEFTGVTGVRVRIGMTDLDVIEHIHELLPCAVRIVGNEKAGRRKTLYTYTRTDRDEVREFLVGVLPYLHERRGLRAEAALKRLEKNLGARSKRTQCLRGHPLAGDNLYVNAQGYRSCLICRRTKDRRKHAKDPARRNAERAARRQRAKERSAVPLF